MTIEISTFHEVKNIQNPAGSRKSQTRDAPPHCPPSPPYFPQLPPVMISVTRLPLIGGNPLAEAEALDDEPLGDEGGPGHGDSLPGHAAETDEVAAVLQGVCEPRGGDAAHAVQGQLWLCEEAVVFQLFAQVALVG